MKNTLFFLFALLMLGSPVMAQTPQNAHASAALEVDSTTKGFLPPRMTTAQRDAIASPATGLTIFNTNTNGVEFYNGTVWESLLSSGATGAPAGTVTAFAGAIAPTGYLFCNGSAVSRTTYANLFNVIGTIYGAGDGSTTFNLPDLRGEFVRGLDGGRGIDPSRVLGSTQTDGIKQHQHTITTQRFSSFDPNGGVYVAGSNLSSTGSWNPGTSLSTANATGANETRPRNVAMNYIIKH